MQTTADPKSRADELFQRIAELDEDALWHLVQRLHPQASGEELEDIFDGLLCDLRRNEPDLPGDEVLAELDRLHGIKR